MTELLVLTATSIILILVLLGLAVYLMYSVLIYIHGAPFVPANRQRVERMVALANMPPGSRVADLGSGDGRIVMAFARKGVQADGYELHPQLVWYSRLVARLKGLSALAKFYRQDIFRVDCSQYRCVTLYVFPNMVSRLEEKLQDELQPGAKVVSLGFAFPTWPHVEKQGSIYVYEKK